VEQRELVQWFRRTYEQVLIFAIPNGGQRSIATASSLKVEGVVPGIPDLFVPEWLLWIEMKRVKNGKLSPAQVEKIEYLTSVCGHRAIVGLGFDDAREKILALTPI
jgi:hypothetical protein